MITNLNQTTRASQNLRSYLDKLGGGSPSFRLCLLLLVASSSVASFIPQLTIGKLLGGVQFIGAAVLILALVGIFETLINDFFPEKFGWDYALEIRHLALMLCSGFYFLLSYLLVESTISLIALPYFLIMATFLAWHAFMDIRKRYGGLK